VSWILRLPAAWFWSIFLLAGAIRAEPAPPGGQRVIAENAFESFSFFQERGAEGTREFIQEKGPGFSGFWRLTTPKQPAETWDLRIFSQELAAVNKDDVLWVRFFLRGRDSRDETGESRTTFVFETADVKHSKSLDLTVSAGPEWREYQFPFSCRQGRPAGESMVSFRFGFRPQVLEVGGLEIWNYGSSKTVDQLPRTRVDYPGREPEAAWRKKAAARIEKIRKAPLKIRLVDAQGQPVEGAEVRVRQLRHAFGFGTAVNGEWLLGPSEDSQRYRETIEQNFSKVVFEDELKWPNWEQNRGARRDITMRAMDWLDQRKIGIRGHVLVWPSWRYLPKDLPDLTEDQLRPRISQHIREILTATQGRITEWDVINEPYAHHNLMDRLGPEAMADWFREARAIDPRPVLFLNDYAGLAAGGLWNEHKQHFEETVKFLQKQKAPIGGIGLQCHFGWSVTPPEKALEELDRWGKLGLEVHLTEFDVETSDEELQADYTRDLLTLSFSHPSVTSVMIWGFWEGRHWRPDAALWRKDWSLKPNGRIWTELTRKTWWTDEQGKTDRRGRWSTRGFLGDYEIEVNGKPAREIRLAKDTGEVEIALP